MCPRGDTKEHRGAQRATGYLDLPLYRDGGNEEACGRCAEPDVEGKSKRRSGEQVELAQRRQLEAFKSSIPSLQVAASFACSVASLSRSPAFQLPGHHHLHGEVLADHQFDWGGLSTCTAAHAQCLLTPSPSQNLQESPPSTK